MRKREEKVTDRESGRERVKDVGRGRVRKREREIVQDIRLMDREEG